jgi:hypothetical protein
VYIGKYGRDEPTKKESGGEQPPRTHRGGVPNLKKCLVVRLEEGFEFVRVNHTERQEPAAEEEATQAGCLPDSGCGGHPPPKFNQCCSLI